MQRLKAREKTMELRGGSQPSASFDRFLLGLNWAMTKKLTESVMSSMMKMVESLVSNMMKDSVVLRPIL